MHSNALLFLGMTVETYLMVSGNLNSCVNPWIYMLFNKKHVKRAFCGVKREEASAAPLVTNYRSGVHQDSARKKTTPENETVYYPATPISNGTTIRKVS